jgi:hypothetical protein
MSGCFLRRAFLPDLLTGAFAGGVERGDRVVAAAPRIVVGRGRAAIRPQAALAVAQPEDAGARVGRQVHRVGERVLPALMQHGARHLALVAHGALVKATRHASVGQDAGLAHRRGERGLGRDPVVDGARGHLEEARQVLVGGAQQAVVARELAVVAAVKGRTSGIGHDAGL